MIEVLAVIGAIALFLFVRMAFRFGGFRKRLLRAFEAHGLSHALANDIYTAHCDTMNDLHINHGMSPEQIAFQYISEMELLNDIRRSNGSLDT